MRITRFLATMLFTVCMAPVTSQASGPMNDYIRMHSDPNEFYLFEQTDSQIFSFDSKETVTVCAGESKHVTALEVQHDGKTGKLKPGNCRDYTAKEFTLSPAGNLADNWSLTGTIEKG